MAAAAPGAADVKGAAAAVGTTAGVGAGAGVGPGDAKMPATAAEVGAAIAAFSYRTRYTLCVTADYQFHKVQWLEWGAADNPEVMVCVHGLTRNAHDFDFFAHRMSARYRVVCVDVPGRGGSDKLKNRANYDYKQYVADLTAVIAQVTAAGGARAVTWVGMSMGGLIGLMIGGLSGAALCPIKRLVLIDIGPVLPKTALDFIAKYVTVRGPFKSLAECRDAMKARYGGSWGPDVTDAHWDYYAPFSFALDSATGLWDWSFDANIGLQVAESTALVKADVDMTLIWGQIPADVPVLVCHGADSTILTPHTCDLMANTGPRATVLHYANTGHLPPLLGADACDVDAWLKRLDAQDKAKAKAALDKTAAK